MTDENLTADDQPAPDVRRSWNRWLLLVPIMLVMAVLGGWLWSTRGSDPPAPGEEPRVKSTMHLETFVLNLADPEQRSYLRVGIDLGLSTELKTGGDGPPIALVRDTILGVLAQGKVDELLTAKGKNQLKEDLLRTLRERVPELGVEEVYFTEFLIQR